VFFSIDKKKPFGLQEMPERLKTAATFHRIELLFALVCTAIVVLVSLLVVLFLNTFQGFVDGLRQNNELLVFGLVALLTVAVFVLIVAAVRLDRLLKLRDGIIEGKYRDFIVSPVHYSYGLVFTPEVLLVLEEDPDLVSKLQELLSDSYLVESDQRLMHSSTTTDQQLEEVRIQSTVASIIQAKLVDLGIYESTPFDNARQMMADQYHAIMSHGGLALAVH